MILFVDINDTCRAPAAAAYARRCGQNACSAGVYAVCGEQADEAAVRAAQPLGIELHAHRARLLSRDMLEHAQRVYCVTAALARHLTQEQPDIAWKIKPFAEIGDPFGAEDAQYSACIQAIVRAVEEL